MAPILEDIQRIVVRPSPSGQHVTVGDVARVSFGFAEASTVARMDGKGAVILTVRKEQGGDIIRLSKEAHRLAREFTKVLPEGVTLKLLGDASQEVKRGLGTLYSNGLIGMVLVLLILWLAIGARNAAMASLGIPAALLGAAIAMYVMDITVSIVALFALILCVGIVVDDAIVIIENVYRHMEAGKSPLQAAFDGTREVMWPVISSVLTTIAAFLPLLIMAGILGKFFSLIPMVVIAALATSLVEALVILPSHMADFGRARPRTHLQRLSRRFAGLADAYLAVLARALRHPLLVSLGALLLAAGLVFAAVATKEVVLIADEDAHRFDVRVEMPRGVTLDRTTEVLKRVEAKALALPENEVVAVTTEVGWSRTRLFPERGKHRGMVTVYLVPTQQRQRRCREIMAALRKQLHDLTGPVAVEVAPVTFSPPKGMPVAIRISGESYPRLKQLSEQVQAELRRLPGVVSVSDDLQPGKRELRVRVQPDRAALHGLNHETVGLFIRAAYGGFAATRYRYLDEELDVVVRYGAEVRDDPARLETIQVGTPLGARVALSQVARITSGRGPSVIEHRDGRRTVSVTADVVEGVATSSGVNRAMQRRLAGLMAANPETKFVFGGEWEETAESLASLFRAFSLAALLIFTILAAQFRSFSQPLVVIFAIPLSLIGVVIGFFVSGEPVGMALTWEPLTPSHRSQLMLPPQTSLVQSLPSLHIMPVPQGGQLPPQSVSVSSWFFMPSVQLSPWQTLPVQTPLRQSVPVKQLSPLGQGEQVSPPQSSSVSLPLTTLSLQVGAAQVPPVQTPLRQSHSPEHFLPSAQAGQIDGTFQGRQHLSHRYLLRPLHQRMPPTKWRIDIEQRIRRHTRPVLHESRAGALDPHSHEGLIRCRPS